MQGIPFIDLRDKDFSQFCNDYGNDAKALLAATRRTYGPFSYGLSALVLPFADRYARRWLQETANPYLHEIERFAKTLKTPGVYALNLSYEFGCTSGVFTATSPRLLRVLDWPFPDLGRRLCLLHQRGPGGDFYNAGWPGVAGVFQAMAPGRFAAAINQAPMRRHGRSLGRDWLRNRKLARKTQALPPAHLLRKVFEEARDFHEAKDRLVQSPVSLPVLFTLSGAKAGEAVIIERLENEAFLHEPDQGAPLGIANRFLGPFKDQGSGWKARGHENPEREAQITSLTPPQESPSSFDWLTPPMINPLTRLVMLADAGAGSLSLQGFEKEGPATTLFSLAAQKPAQAAE